MRKGMKSSLPEKELRMHKCLGDSFSWFSSISSVSNVSLVYDMSPLVDESAAPSGDPPAGLSAPAVSSVDDSMSRSLLDLWQSYGFSGPVQADVLLHHFAIDIIFAYNIIVCNVLVLCFSYVFVYSH